MYRQVIDTAVEKMGKTTSVYQEELRSIRRDAMDHFKKLEKDSKITEDDRTKAEKKMQDETDKAIKTIDELCAKKEKEIMEV